MKETAITRKGQVVIPVEIRRKYNIQPGQKFLVRDSEGEIRLIPLEVVSIKQAQGWLKTKKSVSDLLKEGRTLEKEHEAKLDSL
jgi:AbrB family looped-hinge helix DNA binding protein